MGYQPSPHFYSTVIKKTRLASGQCGYCLTYLIGPVLYDIQFMADEPGVQRKIRRMFEPGPPIKWHQLERDGITTYKGKPILCEQQYCSAL